MHNRFRYRVSAGGAVLAALLVTAATAQSLGELPRRLHEFRLENGVRCAVLERRGSPTVSIVVQAGAGVIDEAKRHTTVMLSRIFPHGSEEWGSRNATQERTLLQAAERHTDAWQASTGNAYAAQDAEIQARMALQNAHAYSVPNFYRDAFAANAIADVQVGAGPENFTMSATANSSRAELVFKAFAEWLRRPSFRAFYPERLVLEEIADRQRPTVQRSAHIAILQAAFEGLPYGDLFSDNPDIKKLRPADLTAFLREQCPASNLAVAVVGDISQAEARRMAEFYFGRLPAAAAASRPVPEPRMIDKERRFHVDADGPEITMIAWYRPNRDHADHAALEVIRALLTAGSNSRLRTALMGARRVARQVQADASFPGDRYQNLFVIETAPTLGFRSAELETETEKVIELMRSQPVPEEELAAVKRRIRRQWLDAAESNGRMAAMLAGAMVARGSTAALAETHEKIQKVTAADVQRAARQWLSKSARFVVTAGIPGVVPAEGVQ